MTNGKSTAMQNIMKKKIMIKKLTNIFLSHTFLIYLIMGGLATIVDWGAFAIFAYAFNWHYTISVTLSFTLGSMTNFSLNKYFNFKNKYKKVHYQFLVYLLVAIIGLGITISIMFLCINFSEISKMVARIIATAIVLIYNFLGHKYITFNLMK